MSDQSDKQVIDILTDINANVGGIRENMIRMESKVDRHDEKITDIQAELKAEGLPTRVRMMERTQQQQGKGFWVMVTAMAGVVAHTVWKTVTGGDA
jgi:hypothetical protein